MIPDPVFIHLARKTGHPTITALRRLDLRRTQAGLECRSLFELARAARLLDADQAAWYEAAAADWLEQRRGLSGAPSLPDLPPAPEAPPPEPDWAAACQPTESAPEEVPAEGMWTSESSLNLKIPGTESIEQVFPAGAKGPAPAPAPAAAPAPAPSPAPPVERPRRERRAPRRTVTQALALGAFCGVLWLCSAVALILSLPAPERPELAAKASRRVESAPASKAWLSQARGALVEATRLAQAGQLGRAHAGLDALEERMRGEAGAAEALALIARGRESLEEIGRPQGGPGASADKAPGDEEPSRDTGLREPWAGEPRKGGRPDGAAPPPKVSNRPRGGPRRPPVGKPELARRAERRAPKRGNSRDEQESDPAFEKRRGRVRKGNSLGYLRLASWARKRRLFPEERVALRLAAEAAPKTTAAKRARKRLRILVAAHKAHSDFRRPWKLSSQWIAVETNTSEEDLHYYCDSVSAFYATFSKIFKVRTNPVKQWGKKVVIRVFRTRADFERYQREQGARPNPGAIGYYSLGAKEIVLYHDAAHPNRTLNVLFHEGAHLFAHLALNHRWSRLPHWVSEGLADYFAAARLQRGKRKLGYGGANYGRLIDVRRQLRATPELSLKAELLAITDYSQFHAGRYALAWSLMHMLIEKKKPGSKKRHRFRARFLRYWSAIVRGEPPLKAFKRYLGPIGAIETEWKEYVLEYPLPPLETGLTHFEAGRLGAAERSFRAHVKAEPKDPRGHCWLGQAQDWAGRPADALPSYRQAIRLRADYLRAHRLLSSALLRVGQSAPALKHAQEVVKILPSAQAQRALASAALAAKSRQVGLKALEALEQAEGESPSSRALRRSLEALK